MRPFEPLEALRSARRNAELVLLAASIGFALLAWHALERAAFPLPDSSGRVLTQFVATVVAGHLALRLIAPGASAVLYATATLLAAVGLAFTVRLAPAVAQDQANWATLGIACMSISAIIGRRYELLRRYRYTAAALALALLLITGFFGTTVNGARLWLNVGGQLVQTTELIKILLIIFVAGYLADEAAVLSMPRLRFGTRTYSALPYLVPLLLALGGAIGALALVRDLGSIAVLTLFVVAMLTLATGRARFLVGGLVLLAITGVLGYLAFDHARARIDVWLDPYDDPSGRGYQTLQSLYAIEAGGITGAGLGLGQPDVIPAAPTDYVFSAVAEELGMAGAIGVVLLYALLFVAGLRVALDARDAYGRLLASSIAVLIAVQASIIIAGNLRIIPTTGITLPFMSYGGSSLVVNFILIGLAMGISATAHARSR